MKAYHSLLLLCLAWPAVAQPFTADPRLARWFEYQEIVSQAPGTFGTRGAESLPRPDHTISVASLRHNPPGKALDAFQRSLKWVSAGKWDRMAAELEKAVAADPDFADAHSNLAVSYIELGLPELAAAEARRAIELDPATGGFHVNLALALLKLNRPLEAEQEAQTAVGLDAANPRAQYILGFLLARKAETRWLAAPHLIYAARVLSDAHLLLARLYQSTGDELLARAELQRYEKAAAQAKNKSHGN